MTSFKELAQAIYSLADTNSRLDKEAKLKKYADMEGFKEILKFINDPYIRTGIAKAKLSKAKHMTVGDDFNGITYTEVIEHFTKNQTGRDVDISYAALFINQFFGEQPETDLATAIVTKNLKIGVTVKTLNKIYGADFIPMIGIMKAEKYEEFKNKVKGPFIVTEKLDGARRILVKENGTSQLYTRSGIPDSGLVDIEREAKYLPDNCVYDGELLAIGEFDNAIELRQASNSIANSKGDRTGVTFNVFDMIPVADFKKGKSTHQARIRKAMLGAMFGDPSIECLTPKYKEMIEQYHIPYDFEYIKSVPIEGIATNEDEIMMLTEPIWQRGFEGTMLNTFTGLYDLTKDRSRDILKVKNVEEHTLLVVGVEAGRPDNKFAGTLGALVLQYGDTTVKAGSGINMAQRDKWWADPSLIIGKYVEIDSFGKSKNKQGGESLNCPIFKRVVGGE